VVELTLPPLTPSVRLVVLDVEAGDIWLDDAPRKLEAGSLTIDVPADGQHLLRIAALKPLMQEAKITFSTAAGTIPTVTLLEAPQRQIVAVSSMGAEARVATSLNGVVAAGDGQPRGPGTRRPRGDDRRRQRPAEDGLHGRPRALARRDDLFRSRRGHCPRRDRGR